MTGLRKDARLSDWMRHVDDLPVDDDALRVFAHLLGTYLASGAEDQEGIASMASIVTDPESDADDVHAALDTLRESLHSTASDVDLESEDELDDAERDVARRMDSEEATFAERLRTTMAAKSMSQVQLAKVSGVGQPAISMMLSRDCRPQRRTVEKLSRALGVSPEELWSGSASAGTAAENSIGQEVVSLSEVGEWAIEAPLRRPDGPGRSAKTD